MTATALKSVDEAWQELTIHLEWADRFWMLFVFTDDPRVIENLRDRTRAQLETAGQSLVELRPSLNDEGKVPDEAVFEVLLDGCPNAVAWVDFVRHDAPGSTAWRDAWQRLCRQLNQRRELLRRKWPTGGIVMATTLDRLDATPGTAPDLWTIRSLLLRVATLPADVGATLSEPSLHALDDPSGRGPKRDPELARQAVDRARRRWEAEPSDEALRGLAAALDTYGDSLISSGRWQEAVATTQEAVEHFRELTSADPDASMPGLAKSLNSLAVILRSLGRREDALSTSQEALGIRKQLAQADPDAFLPDFAKSLGNLGIFLVELGRREEALAAAQESVELYRKLASANPDVLLPELARSLDNLGVCLSELGRREEALAATAEAMEHYHTLASANPDSFLRDLARALTHFGASLSELGWREKAVEATQAAVGHYRKLGSANPDTLLPDLALSLSNLGAQLSNLGRREESLAASQEAVELYRKLASDAFLPEFATSLNNLGHLHKALGDPLLARDHHAEALRIILPYFVKLPAAHAETTIKAAQALERLRLAHGVEIPEALAPAVAHLLDLTKDGTPDWSEKNLVRTWQFIPPYQPPQTTALEPTP